MFRFKKFIVPTLKTFSIVIATFEIEDKKKNSSFFKEIFLFANFIIKVILRIPFLILNNVKINFFKQEFFQEFISLL